MEQNEEGKSAGVSVAAKRQSSMSSEVPHCTQLAFCRRYMLLSLAERLGLQSV